eukprot:COSAG02_NODE_5689_length_4126_cov_1.759374_2_plen_66_part_00
MGGMCVCGCGCVYSNVTIEPFLALPRFTPATAELCVCVYSNVTIEPFLALPRFTPATAELPTLPG